MRAYHTPGPWEPVSDDHYVVPVGVVTPMVALVFHGEHRAANARLISAAPDMLAALQDAPCPSTMGDAREHYQRFYAWLEGPARAAIRKALSDSPEASRSEGEGG